MNRRDLLGKLKGLPLVGVFVATSDAQAEQPSSIRAQCCDLQCKRHPYHLDGQLDFFGRGVPEVNCFAPRYGLQIISSRPLRDHRDAVYTVTCTNADPCFFGPCADGCIRPMMLKRDRKYFHLQQPQQRPERE